MKQVSGIEPRNNFLAPRFYVYKIPDGKAPEWEKVPPLPVAMDMQGEVLNPLSVTVQLAWNTHGFHLRADVMENALTEKPDFGPESPLFWTKDHVELRLMTDPEQDQQQTQFILGCDGQWFDSADSFKSPDHGMHYNVEKDEHGWIATAFLPFETMNITPPSPGQCVRMLLARTRWGEGYPEFACFSPCDIGFHHGPHFAAFIFADRQPEIDVTLGAVRTPDNELREGDNAFDICLNNPLPHEIQGALLVSKDTVDETAAGTRRIPCTLSPGANIVNTCLFLERPLFTRYAFTFVGDEGAEELGCFTLRAPVPELPDAVWNLDHPYLFFDQKSIQRIRKKLREPPCNRVAETDTDGIERLKQLPSENDISLDFREQDGSWFRIARESMLRNAEKLGKQPYQKIWSLLSDDAREAFRGIVDSVTPSEEQVACVLEGMNALLTRRDLYDKEAFANVNLPDEAAALRRQDWNTLSDHEIKFFNRCLLQNTIECLREFRLDLPRNAVQCFNQWVRNGDGELLDVAAEYAELGSRFAVMGPHVDLHTGGLSNGLALAYDGFYPYLCDEQKQKWQELLTRFLDMYLYAARKGHWNTATNANANAVCNGGGGLLAMALLSEYPEKAGEALQWARKRIRTWLDYCPGKDGGNTEGAQYWQYGTENFLPFASALEKLLGHDDQLLNHPAIRNMMNMVRVGLSNDGRMHGVNDTIPMPVGGALGWFAAARFNDPVGLWYGDHALRVYKTMKNQDKPVPYRAGDNLSVLYRPDIPEATEPPAFPTTFCLRDIQYTVLRSRPAFDAPLVAGLKGSRAPYTHHNQPDTGSFYIHLHGERLLIDPGYYKSDAQLHSLPVINGVGPKTPPGWTGQILACKSAGEWRYALCDSTAAYEEAVHRVCRHLLMIGDKEIVLVDDIAAEGDVMTYYQCGGPTEAIGNDETRILVRGKKANIIFSLFGPEPLDPVCHPERALDDIHWGYKFAECRHFPVSVDYKPDERIPLVTVFQDVTDCEPGPIEVERGQDRMKVSLPSGHSPQFILTRQGWIFDDAY